MHLLQRKYIDLIYQVSSKWVNWDPPIPIEVRRVSLFPLISYIPPTLATGRRVWHRRT